MTALPALDSDPATQAFRMQVRDWLGDIGPPQDVTLVPGNHDAYVASTWPRCGDLWCDYMRGDDARPGAPVTFPYLRRRGPLLLIGVSTAVPTAPFMATGELGQAQLDALTFEDLARDRFELVACLLQLRARRHQR